LTSRAKHDYPRTRFPAAGPVREYRPLILSQALWYSRKYYINFFDVLSEAVTLAHLAEKKFDPARGKFSTLLLWELQRLHRICQREYRRRVVRPRPRKGDVQDWERENERARQVRQRTSEVCWDAGCQDFLERVDRDIRFKAKVLGLTRKRDDYGRGKPRNWKRWKAAVGREKWSAVAERIGALPLDNDKWRAMRGWMVGDLLGSEGRTMSEAAADLGITKGYASKIVCQIAKACSASVQHSG
jgi:hypothetical protein